MPIVRIDVDEERSDEQRQAISAAVHRAFVNSIGIPEGDRFHVVTSHPRTELIADPRFLGVDRKNVVFIQTTLVRGRSDELKQELYRAIRDHLVELGVRAEDIAIVLTENGPADYSWGNGEAQVLGLGPLAGTR